MESKKVLVVGASSGIGYAIYRHCQQKYDHVIGVSRRGPDKYVDMADMGSLKGVQDSYDLIIYAAGIMPLREDNEEIRILTVNFLNFSFLIQNLVSKMDGNDPQVIAISSVSALHPDPHQSMYAASKAAMNAWMRSMALRYAKKVRFNLVSPGFFDTDLVPGETPKNLIDSIPMKREAKPEEILPVIDMLIETKYMTGANIVIDGGLSI